MKTVICLGKVSIAGVRNNAGVFYGENALRGWRTRVKSNAGAGRVTGDGNLVVSRLNLLNDPDVVDTPAANTRNGPPQV
ncbi:MAG: hypothetical protein ACUVRC_04225 [Desulfotomaculales bacterium]